GSAPSTPACQEPSVLTTLPCSSSSLVSSPKYQTFPSLSCAYQSSVTSNGVPLWLATSLTTTQVTPRITFVSAETLTSSRWRSRSFVPSSTNVVAGMRLKYGLSMVETKLAGSIAGWPEAGGEAWGLGPPGDPAAVPLDVGAGDDVHAPAISAPRQRTRVSILDMRPP